MPLISDFPALPGFYQLLFLQALQGYFKQSTRLVKQGDIIAVGIDTDDLLRQPSALDEDGGEVDVQEMVVGMEGTGRRIEVRCSGTSSGLMEIGHVTCRLAFTDGGI